MMNNTTELIKVKGKEVSQEEFNKLQEDISKDKNKKLKKISESEYTVIQKLEG
jgi:hypothetical protein